MEEQKHLNDQFYNKQLNSHNNVNTIDTPDQILYSGIKYTHLNNNVESMSISFSIHTFIKQIL